MSRVRLLWQRAVDFILAEGDPHSLAFLRIGIGLSVVWQLGFYLAQFNLWFSTRGWLNSNCENTSNVGSFCLLNGVRHDQTLLFFVVFTLLSAVSMVIGLKSRWATLFTWIGVTSIQARVNSTLCGGDVVIVFLLFFMVFSDSGAVWSIDRLRLKTKRDTKVPLWPQRLMAVMVSILYFAATLHKLSDSCWVDGTAVYYALHYADFKNFWLPGFMRQPPFTVLMTYGTLVTELSLGVVLFLPKYRKLILLNGVVLHLGISYMMFIAYFTPVMLLSYVSFLSGEETAKGVKTIWAILTRRRRNA